MIKQSSRKLLNPLQKWLTLLRIEANSKDQGGGKDPSKPKPEPSKDRGDHGGGGGRGPVRRPTKDRSDHGGGPGH